MPISGLNAEELKSPIRLDEWWSKITLVLIFVTALILMVHQTYVPLLRTTMVNIRWLALGSLFTMALLLIASKRKLPRKLYLFDYVAFMFLGLNVISTIYSISPSITIQRATTLILMFGATFWTIWAVTDYHRPGIVVKIVLGACAVLFCLNYFAIIISPQQSFPYLGRFTGILENPNTVGVLVALMLPLSVWATLEFRQRRYLLLSTVLLVSLVLSQARLELLTTIVGSGYLLIQARPNHRFIVGLAAIALISINIGLTQLTFYTVTIPAQPSVEASETVPHQSADSSYTVTMPAQPTMEASETVPHQSVDSPYTVTMPAQPTVEASDPTSPHQSVDSSSVESLERSWQENPRNREWESGSGRLIAWQYGIHYLTERPWLGFGFGTEDQILTFHGIKPGSTTFYGQYFHNSILGLALQVGIVGALLLYVPLGALVLGELRSTARYSEAPLRFALRGVLLAGLASSLFESWLISMGNAFSFPFWISVMLLARFSVTNVTPSTKR